MVGVERKRVLTPVWPLTARVTPARCAQSGNSPLDDHHDLGGEHDNDGDGGRNLRDRCVYAGSVAAEGFWQIKRQGTARNHISVGHVSTTDLINKTRIYNLQIKQEILGQFSAIGSDVCTILTER